MKASEKPERYEAVPLRMILPGIPHATEGALPNAPTERDEGFHCPEEIPIVGASTLPTCPDRAQREAEELLRHCRNRLRHGERWAIVDLLDDNPLFICHRWVREEIVRLLEGGFSLRKGGRPRGRYKVHPLVVVGLVQHLIETGRAKNVERAFAKLEGLHVLPYESAKDSYYRGLREKRFRPTLIEFPELASTISAEDAMAAVLRGEVLQAGGEITRTWEDPCLGTLKITFRGQ